jgi:hypothetical protein
LIAVDTNVLVYAHRRDLRFHEGALNALERLASGTDPWAIPWPVAHEFLAIVTGRAFGERRTPVTVAFAALEAWLAHPLCRPLAEGTEHLVVLGGLMQRAGLTGAAIHDARIAAICIEHEVDELWTADRDFTRFPDLRTRNPLIPTLEEPLPRHGRTRREVPPRRKASAPSHER